MKGILFKSWKIRFIRDHPDMEIATRRVSGLKEINQEPDKWHFVGNAVGGCLFEHQDGRRVWVKSRYQVKETVYIKEAHYAYGEWRKELRGWVFYRDEEMAVAFDSTIWEHALKGHQGLGWYRRSAMFLPAKDARTFVKILDVRPERLNLPLSTEELKLEGGEQALEMLETINGFWVFRYLFKLEKRK